MYILQNALKNIGRNKGRNMLIAILTLIIILTTCIALVITNASSSIIDQYTSRFGSKVTIVPDTQKLMQLGKGEEITPIQQLDFAKSDLLQKTDIVATDMARSKTLKAVNQDKDPMAQKTINDSFGPPTMSIKGYVDLNENADFSNGMRKILEGNAPKNPNEVILSEELAKLNNLSIGSKISVTTVAMRTQAQTKSYEFTVSGIYSDGTKAYPNGVPEDMSRFNRRNDIITNINTLIDKNNLTSKSTVQIESTFYLKNPDLLPDFKKELQSKGLDTSLFGVTTDRDGYNKIVKPVEGMKSTATTFLIVVLVLGAIILILLSMIAMRERKYEVGVLRAMGMRKGKVAYGFFIETLLITAVCLVIALGIGTFISQPVSNAMLNNQIESLQENTPASPANQIKVFDPSKSNSDDEKIEPITQIDVGLDAKTLWEIIIISLLLSGISSTVSIRYISQYEPIKILSNRD